MTIVALAGFEQGTALKTLLTSGTTSFVTSPNIGGGTYSLRVNPVTTGVGHVQLGAFGADGDLAAFNVATAWATFKFRVDTLPASGDEIICGLQNTLNNQKFRVRIGADGKLYGYNQAATLVASGTTVLSTGVTYVIGLKVGTSATVGAYEVTINGVSEWSGTTNTTANNNGRLILGKIANVNGNTVDCYFDDAIIDDTAYAAQASSVASLANATANGSTMSWTTGTNASNYLEVDETVSDHTDYVKNDGLSANQVAVFAHKSMATLGITGSQILAADFMTTFRENTAVTSSYKTRCISGATTTDTTGFDGSTGIAIIGNTLVTDPNTSAAWTETALNASEVGGIETLAVSDRMTWVGVEVGYLPAVTKNLLLLGVS